MIPIGGLALFAHLVRKGLNVSADLKEKSSARNWFVTGAVLLIVGPVAHGVVELAGHRSLSNDPLIGGWMFLGMVWLLFDWDRTWMRLTTEGKKRGYTTQSAALLLNFVVSITVLIAYLDLVFSVMGIEMPSGLFAAP